MEKKIKNNQSKYFIIGIFILIVAIIVAIFTTLAINSNPCKIYKTAIDKLLNQTENDLEKIDKNYKMDWDLALDLSKTNSLETSFKNINLNLDLYYNPTNTNKTAINIESKIDNQNFINAEGIILDNNFYIKLVDIYEKFLKIDFREYITEIPQTNNEDLSYIIKSFKEALLRSLKEEYFTQETTSITYNDKEIKVNKNILNLTKENFQEMEKNVIDELNNTEFLNKLSKLLNEDYDTLKQNLEDYYNEIDNSDYTYEETNIIMYTKKYSNEFMQLEIIQGKDKLTISKKDRENFTFELLSSENLNGTISFKDKEINLTVFYEEIEIKLNLKITENIDIPDYDYSDYVDINNIPETDEYNILKKLYEKIIKLGLDIEM